MKCSDTAAARFSIFLEKALVRRVNRRIGSGSVSAVAPSNLATTGSDSDTTHADTKYSPGRVLSVEFDVKQGDPDMAHASTSYVERQNLTMRMSMRRFTRLTNAFSKKIENHAAAVSLHFAYYNLCRPHQTLSKPYPRTPAMAAGVEDHVLTLDELDALLEARKAALSGDAHRQVRGS